MPWADCKLHRNAPNGDGYAHVKIKGRSFKAHRLAYLAYYGEIPEGMHVLHRCDTRNCVNPDHLFVGTNEDNISDKCLKDRSGKKLTIEKVKEAREMYSRGVSQGRIARLFGVNPCSISRAITGVRWNHVEKNADGSAVSGRVR